MAMEESIMKDRTEYDTAWKRNNTVRIACRLNKTKDADLIEYCKSLENIQATIKEALREHMKKSGK